MDFGTGRESATTPRLGFDGHPSVCGTGSARRTARHSCKAMSTVLAFCSFHVLTGSYPVLGRDLATFRAAHDASSRVSLRAIRPDVPAPLARVIERAVDAAPNRVINAPLRSAPLFGHATTGIARRRLIYGAAAAAVVLAGGAGLLRDACAPRRDRSP